jgi:hypothetical protein
MRVYMIKYLSFFCPLFSLSAFAFYAENDRSNCLELDKCSISISIKPPLEVKKAATKFVKELSKERKSEISIPNEAHLPSGQLLVQGLIWRSKDTKEPVKVLNDARGKLESEKNWCWAQSCGKWNCLLTIPTKDHPIKAFLYKCNRKQLGPQIRGQKSQIAKPKAWILIYDQEFLVYIERGLVNEQNTDIINASPTKQYMEFPQMPEKALVALFSDSSSPDTDSGIPIEELNLKKLEFLKEDMTEDEIEAVFGSPAGIPIEELNLKKLEFLKEDMTEDEIEAVFGSPASMLLEEISLENLRFLEQDMTKEARRAIFGSPLE